jgi:hypothetical protein
MSDDRSRRGAAETERIDRLIDEVAQQMTEGELPADFRARVVSHLTSNDARRTTNGFPRWVFAPIAATALIVVALFVARPGRDRGVHTPTRRESPRVAAQTVQPGENAPAPNVRLKPDTTYRATYAARRMNTRATDADAEIAALAPPPIVAPSIAIDTLTTESIAVQEMEPVTPIAVAPLPAPEGERP